MNRQNSQVMSSALRHGERRACICCSLCSVLSVYLGLKVEGGVASLLVASGCSVGCKSCYVFNFCLQSKVKGAVGIDGGVYVIVVVCSQATVVSISF